MRRGMIALLITVLLVGGEKAASAVPGQSQEGRANQLASAVPVLELDDVAPHVNLRLSPDGRYLAVCTSTVSRRPPFLCDAAKLYDLAATPPKVIGPQVGQISAAFTRDGRGAWLGTATGSMRLLELPAARAIRSEQLEGTLRPDRLLISPDGRLLAWYDRKTETAGLFDLHTRQGVERWKHVSNVAFTPEGKYLVFYISRPLPPPAAQRDMGLVLWNLVGRHAEVKLDITSSHLSPGYAFAQGGLYYSTRRDGSYEIRRRDLATGADIVIDPDARKAHAIDVSASPGGRYLAERNTDERGIRIYDLSRDHTARTFEWSGFAGWDPVSDLMLTLDGAEKGLTVRDPLSGQRLASLGGRANRPVIGALISADGRRLVATRWSPDSPGTPIRRHITVFRIPDGRCGPKPFC